MSKLPDMLVELKFDLIEHFTTGLGHNIRIAPHEGDEYKELLGTVYIDCCLPWLETYYDPFWKETAVRPVAGVEIDQEELVEYYKKALEEFKNYHWNVIGKIQEVMDI